MKRFDRLLLQEFLKFVLLALAAVVLIYILIDLFEELSYFLGRRVPLPTVLLYYLYFAPSAIDLLYPVSFVLACFMVYGQLARNRELAALQTAGVNTYRLFLPVLTFGVLASVLVFLGHELIALPAARALDDLKRYRIEKRSPPAAATRRDLHYQTPDGRVFFIQQFEPAGVMRNFMIVSFDSSRRRIIERLDGNEAVWRNGYWLARQVKLRRFLGDTIPEQLIRYDSLILAGVNEPPREFILEVRPIEQLMVSELRRYAERMRRTGYRTDRELVELHYRYSYPVTGLILLLMALPLAVQLPRGGVMLGLGLGLLFSFLFWCAIQAARAFGATGIISPVLAAWLPNIIFLIVGIALMPTVRK